MVKTYFLVEIESEYEVAADTLAQNIQSRFPTSVESVKVEAVEQPLAPDVGDSVLEDSPFETGIRRGAVVIPPAAGKA